MTGGRAENISASIDEDEEKGKKTSVHPLMRTRRRENIGASIDKDEEKGENIGASIDEDE